MEAKNTNKAKPDFNLHPTTQPIKRSFAEKRDAVVFRRFLRLVSIHFKAMKSQKRNYEFLPESVKAAIINVQPKPADNNEFQIYSPQHQFENTIDIKCKEVTSLNQ